MLYDVVARYFKNFYIVLHQRVSTCRNTEEREHIETTKL